MQMTAKPLPNGGGRTVLVREDTGEPMTLRVETRPAKMALGRTKVIIGFGRTGVRMPLCGFDLEAN